MAVQTIPMALNPITLVMPMVWLQALFQSQHLLLPSDSADSSGSSSSGCVYNPNAPARFDMGFILLIVLSAYYLIRRKKNLF
jgi:hypothetical protein